MFAWLRARRVRAHLARPFPADWATILARDVAHYDLLTESQQAALRECVQVLVAELHWEGANGLLVTDRMRVVVAAGAALLLLRERHDYFAQVSGVILYPGAFRRPGDDDDVLAPDPGELAGEASHRGPVVLSWPEARAEAADPTLGYHLVVHEFAHQLDHASGEADGTPPLPDRAAAGRWHAAFAPALERHLAELRATGESLFSPDALDPVEFFADCCEAFVASPRDLLEVEPEVYRELSGYFGLDPAAWSAADAGE